jgi:hypothetical protein
VFPPAPAYLFQWPFSSSPKPWQGSASPDKYRRALYTFRYRSVPYPALRVFDAPSGEFAVVNRTRSNTPLQALTTLNEPLFVECAQALAHRALDEGGASDRDRLRYAFRRCVGREPSPDEADLLLSVLDDETRRFRASREDADAVAGGGDADSDRASHAAWTVVSRILLNLDETITKE